MQKGHVAIFLTALALLFTSFLARQTDHPPAPPPFTIDTIASGLSTPWDIVFLPNKDMLFTERPGRVRLYRSNTLVEKPVLTIDGIEATGKMGLLGCCLHPNYATNHFVYLAYNYRKDNQTFLRVVRYEYSSDSLILPKTIIENIPGVFNHTGSRLKFGADNKLYITTGDADIPRLAQDLKVYNGKILRLEDDGRIPLDNPFQKNDTAKHEIWTYGHRNPQGIAFQPGTNLLFSSEHGPTGGDEINLVTRGNNYGWPAIHHRDKKDGMMNPVMEFTPSIGPAEAFFYSGKAFPQLKGHLLVACMRGEAILDISLQNSRIIAYDFLLKNYFGRIRALAEGPDGSIYLSTSQVDPPESRLQPGERDYDLIVRLSPNGASHDDFSGKMTAAINNLTEAPANGIKTETSASVKYGQLCAGCHGANMQGKENVPSLVDKVWLNGGTKTAIKKSISEGIITKGMPAWEGVLTAAETEKMAVYILNKK